MKCFLKVLYMNQGIPALVDLLCANHNPHHPCLVAA